MAHPRAISKAKVTVASSKQESSCAFGKHNGTTFAALAGAVSLLLSTAGAPACLAADAKSAETARVVHVGHEALVLGTQPFEKITLVREGAPSLSFFISRPPHPAPLLLYIQGSGCSPVFITMPDGQPASTVFSLMPSAQEGRFTVMVVDKPLAPATRPPSAGTAIQCPKEFNEYFSFASWSRDLRQAFEYALALPWIDPRRTLVIGFSEGATMAATLAGTEPGVTDVALLGATGPGQFFDFVVGAYRSGKTDAEVLAKIDDLEITRRLIAADPESAAKFAWGHPYKRWSSFFAASSNRSLMSSQARMYLVSGMGDENVPILSTEALYSELSAAGKRISLRRIPGASHSLLPAGAKDFQQLGEEIRRIFVWYDDGR